MRQKKQQISSNFNQENIDEEFLINVVKLSYLDDGPIIAKEYLSKFGINLVFFAPSFKKNLCRWSSNKKQITVLSSA